MREGSRFANGPCFSSHGKKTVWAVWNVLPDFTEALLHHLEVSDPVVWSNQQMHRPWQDKEETPCKVQLISTKAALAELVKVGNTSKLQTVFSFPMRKIFLQIIVTFGFLASPKSIQLDTRFESVASLDPHIITYLNFKMAAILKSNMAAYW